MPTSSAAGGRESVLFTASLKESDADAEPTPVVGRRRRPARRRVAVRARHRQHPAALVRRLAAADRVGRARARRALGTAIAIDGIARGSSEAVVERLERMAVDRPHRRERDAARRARRRPRARWRDVTPLPGRRDGAHRRADSTTTGIPTGDDGGASSPPTARPTADRGARDGCRAADVRLAERPLRRGARRARCRRQPLRHVPAAAAGAARDARHRARRPAPRSSRSPGSTISWCQVPPAVSDVAASCARRPAPTSRASRRGRSAAARRAR